MFSYVQLSPPLFCVYFSPIRAKCTAHPWFDYVMISCKKCKSWSSCVCNFLHSPVTSSFLCHYVPSATRQSTRTSVLVATNNTCWHSLWFLITWVVYVSGVWKLLSGCNTATLTAMRVSSVAVATCTCTAVYKVRGRLQYRQLNKSCSSSSVGIVRGIYTSTAVLKLSTHVLGGSLCMLKYIYIYIF